MSTFHYSKLLFGYKWIFSSIMTEKNHFVLTRGLYLVRLTTSLRVR